MEWVQQAGHGKEGAKVPEIGWMSMSFSKMKKSKSKGRHQRWRNEVGGLTNTSGYRHLELRREARGGRKRVNLDSISSLSLLLCKTEVSIKRKPFRFLLLKSCALMSLYTDQHPPSTLTLQIQNKHMTWICGVFFNIVNYFIPQLKIW